MNPWLAAYLGAHITAMIAILTVWPIYLSSSRLHPTRSGKVMAQITISVILPVFLVGSIGALRLLSLVLEVWDKGAARGLQAHKEEMREIVRSV